MSAIKWHEEQLEILVIADEEVDRIAFASMLHYTGFNINLHQVNSGKEGLDWILNNFLDCIFLDYPMANPDGLTVLREIREKGKTIPVIMLIGHGYEHLAYELMESGAKDYLLKEQLSTDKIITVLNSCIRLHQAERKTHLVEEQLSILSQAVEQSTTAIIITDINGTIEYVNSTYCQLTGFNSEEVLGKTPSILKSGETPPEEYEKMWDAITSGREWRGIFCNRKKNGEMFWESTVISPIRNKTGLITHFLAIKEDITESKRSADALWEANEKLSAIIQESPLAIIVVDVKGVITSWSDAAERTFGWKAEEAIGQSIPIRPENNSPEFREIELQTFAGGHTHDVVLVGWRKKDGANIDINCFSSPLYDTQGNITGNILLIDDITDRRRSENELLETRQQANKALRVASLGALAAGIAHEINQPLNSIKLISDTMLYLLNGGKKLSDDKVIHKLKEISNQVDRVSGIIQHMRSVIRHEPDSAQTIFDVNQVILKAETLMQYNLEKSNIKLSYSLSEQLPCIRGSWNSLEAVIINLITNAIQALEITDKTAKVITCTTWLEENIIIEISDNGTGIKESLKDSLFEPFISNKTDQGMGLGLFIVQVLVANMNGHISVSNNEQGGATFRLEIPVI